MWMKTRLGMFILFKWLNCVTYNWFLRLITTLTLLRNLKSSSRKHCGKFRLTVTQSKQKRHIVLDISAKYLRLKSRRTFFSYLKWMDEENSSVCKMFCSSWLTRWLVCEAEWFKNYSREKYKIPQDILIFSGDITFKPTRLMPTGFYLILYDFQTPDNSHA